jgi:hypothetical protein
MAWTYCPVCGLRTEWAPSCSECGSVNPLYGLCFSGHVRDEVGLAEWLDWLERARGVGMRENAKPASFWQSWGYFAAAVLLSSLAMAVLLVPPNFFW